MMRLKKYIEKNGVLITPEIRNTYLPFLTTDGKDVLNETFELEFGMKEMFSDNVEVNNRKIKNVLLKNFNKYDKINEALKSQLSVEYNKLIEDDGKDLRDLNLTDERKPDLTHTRKPDLTDKREPNLTDKREPNLTDERKPLTTTTKTAGIKETVETVEPKKTTTSTTSTKPFDSETFIDVEKTVDVEGSVVETEPISADYKTTETRTPEGTESVSESGTDTTTHKGTDTTTHTGTDTTTHTGTETTTESGKDTTTHTGTDTLTKTNIQKIKDENILEYLNKYMEFYSYNLYIPIIEDIIEILCYSTWDEYECSFFEIIE